jgi:hypothetical protein
MLRLFQWIRTGSNRKKTLIKWIRTDSRRKETRSNKLGQQQTGKKLNQIDRDRLGQEEESLKWIWTGLGKNETFSNGFGQARVGMRPSSEFGHDVVPKRKENYFTMVKRLDPV